MSASDGPAALERLAELVSNHIGMRCDDFAHERLREIITTRLKGAGADGVDTYLDRLADPASKEWRWLAREVTVGETYFFRGHDHFRALTEIVIPNLLKMRAKTRRLRVLSAACASGEEPYSLAIALKEGIVDLMSWQIDIIAADINSTFLAKAKRGLYTHWSLREVSESTIERYFHRAGIQYELDPAVRAMVEFKEVNLLVADEFWAQPPFDLIFCRNLLIYLTPDALSALLTRMENALARGGYLFLGHAEGLRGLARSLRVCQSQEAFYYQSSDEAESLPGERTSSRQENITPAPPEPTFGNESWTRAIARTSERIIGLSEKNNSTGCKPLAADFADGTGAIARALSLFRSERYAEAIKILQEGRKAPADTEGLVLLAAALIHQGRITEAEAVCREQHAIDALNAETEYLLALCSAHSGDDPAAIRHAQKAAYLDASFGCPRLLLGRIAQKRGEKRTARRELAAARDLLLQEDPMRVLLFGGGFSTRALAEICNSELSTCGSEA